MAPTTKSDDVAEPFFPCSWDSNAWTATAFSVGMLIALAALLAGMGALLFRSAQMASGLCFVGSMATLCIVMGLSQYGITGYRITADAIMVVRRRGSIRIPVESIESVTLVETDVLHGTRRVYGTGWAFGNAGILASPRWERLQVYITRKDSLVLIERTGDIPVLLSPDKPRAFTYAFHGARETHREK